MLTIPCNGTEAFAITEVRELTGHVYFFLLFFTRPLKLTEVCGNHNNRLGFSNLGQNSDKKYDGLMWSTRRNKLLAKVETTKTYQCRHLDEYTSVKHLTHCFNNISLNSDL